MTARNAPARPFPRSGRAGTPATVPPPGIVAGPNTSGLTVGGEATVSPGTKRGRKPKLTGLALMASLMPENGGSDSLDYKLRKLLEGLPGLLYQHNSDSRRAHAGFPDWSILGPGGFIVRELKRETTQPTLLQARWLSMLRAAGVDAGVWRPSDYLNGTIQRTLAALAWPGRAA